MTDYIDIVMNAVESSNIESIGYNAEHQRLAINFKNGSAYHYKDVPQDVFDKLMESNSKGEFLSKNIKDKFSAEKISTKFNDDLGLDSSD